MSCDSSQGKCSEIGWLRENWLIWEDSTFINRAFHRNCGQAVSQRLRRVKARLDWLGVLKCVSASLRASQRGWEEDCRRFPYCLSCKLLKAFGERLGWWGTQIVIHIRHDIFNENFCAYKLNIMLEKMAWFKSGLHLTVIPMVSSSEHFRWLSV